MSRKEKKKLEEKKNIIERNKRKIKKSKNRNKNKYRNADRTQKPRIDNDISEIAVTLDKNPKENNNEERQKPQNKKVKRKKKKIIFL